VTRASFFQCWGVKNAPDEYFRVNKFFLWKLKIVSAFYFAEVVHYLCSIRSKCHEEIFREAEWSSNEEKWIYRGEINVGKKVMGSRSCENASFQIAQFVYQQRCFVKLLWRQLLSEKAATKCTSLVSQIVYSFFQSIDATRISSPSWCINRLRGFCSDERTCA